MKNFLNIIVPILFFGLLMGCKSYGEIENVTSKNDPNLTKKENLVNQLNQVEKKEKIQIFLLNGNSHHLIYLSHSTDSVYTHLPTDSKNNLNQPTPQSMNLAFSEVEKIKVWRVNYVLTIGPPAAALVGYLIFLAVWDMNLGLGED